MQPLKPGKETLMPYHNMMASIKYQYIRCNLDFQEPFDKDLKNSDSQLVFFDYN